MSPMIAESDKYRLLQRYTRKASVLEELMRYTRQTFVSSSFTQPVYFPLPDEPHIATWENYLDRAEEEGVFQTLCNHLVQFCFPIREGISQTEDYRAATRKGHATEAMGEATGLKLEEPEGLELRIYQSLAGKVPVLKVSHKGDFQTIIQALSYKNEPLPVPASMGAAMISGINNWDRIRRLKANWQRTQPLGSWEQQFKQSVLPHTALYQDKLIVLSQAPYSNVPAETLQFDHEKWLQYSAEIRLEHECTHLFTLRYFGSMRNNMHDELLADYMGISRITGGFRSDWFLRFIGLEGYPRYREGGRLENYRGTPPLSPQAFEILQQIMVQAAQQVETFDRSLGPMQSLSDRSRRLLALCSLTLEQLAAANAVEKLTQSYHGHFFSET